MRKSIVVAVTGIACLSLTGALVFPVTAAQEADSPRNTIERCAGLLPAGSVYAFELTGRIDTTGQAPQLSGSLEVSDDSGADRSGETAAFGECLASLIR